MWSTCRRGRAPHGARGLKSFSKDLSVSLSGRAPHGARGLKLVNQCAASIGQVRRAPHGARGLKCDIVGYIRWDGQVAPHTGRVD